MKAEVFVVYRSDISTDQMTIYAICTSRKGAEMARNKLKKLRIGGQLVFPKEVIGDARFSPKTFPYGRPFKIAKVSVDMLYPHGLSEHKLHEFGGNDNEKEVIA